jgi:hypothetical protein
MFVILHCLVLSAPDATLEKQALTVNGHAASVR